MLRAELYRTTRDPSDVSPWQDLLSQAAGWAVGLPPCNFMLDLSCQRPQSLSISIPTRPLNHFAVKTFFPFFLAFFFTSRAGSRSLSINSTIFTCKTHSFDNLSIPAVRFLTSLILSIRNLSKRLVYHHEVVGSCNTFCCASCVGRCPAGRCGGQNKQHGF